MILDLSELRNRDFQLKNVNIFLQKPTYRRIDPKPNGRKMNGFLYILEGMGRYSFEEGSFLLEPGSVVYLPTGSRHTFEILNDGITFYRVDFDLFVDGERAYFSTHPLKMCRKAGPSFDRAIREMADRYEFLQDTVGKMALLCTAFRSLYEDREEAESRLEPAVRYLLEHLTEKVCVSELASACYLSTAQFYNLFHAVYHTTPLEYRAALLYEKARSLLHTGSFSVTEISEMLGFDTVSYFSRFFKKRCGVSPAAYLKCTQ